MVLQMAHFMSFGRARKVKSGDLCHDDNKFGRFKCNKTTWLGVSVKSIISIILCQTISLSCIVALENELVGPAG